MVLYTLLYRVFIRGIKEKSCASFSLFLNLSQTVFHNEGKTKKLSTFSLFFQNFM